MSSDTTIIYSVEKPKELVMLGKKMSFYVQLRMTPLLLLLFLFFYSFHWENSTVEISTSSFFGFSLKTPHKKLGSWVIADQRPDLTGNVRGQHSYQKKQELPNRFFSLFNPAESLKLNTLIMPVISYCSASCLQPGN